MGTGTHAKDLRRSLHFDTLVAKPLPTFNSKHNKTPMEPIAASMCRLALIRIATDMVRPVSSPTRLRQRSGGSQAAVCVFAPHA